MANDDRNVELRIDMGGDAPEKLRALAEALAQADAQLKQLMDTGRQAEAIQYKAPIDRASKVLESRIKREQTAEMVEQLDPERAIRGPDPRAVRAAQLAQAAEAADDVSNSRWATKNRIRTHEEFSRMDREEADADTSNRDWSARVRRGKEAAFAADEANYHRRIASERRERDRYRTREQKEVDSRAREAKRMGFDPNKTYTTADLAKMGNVGRGRRGPPGGGGGLFGGRGGRGLGRMGRYGGRFLAIYAASAAIRGLEKGLEDFSNRADRSTVAFGNAGIALRDMGLHAAEAIPIVGGVVAAIANVQSVVGGENLQKSIGARQEQQNQIGFAVESTRQRLTLRAEAQIRSAGYDVQGQEIRANAQGRFADYLQQPGVAQSFYHLPGDPSSSPGLDRATLSAQRARFQLEAANDIVPQRQWALDVAKTRAWGFGEHLQRREDELGAARNRQAEAQAAVDAREDPGNGGGAWEDFWGFSLSRRIQEARAGRPLGDRQAGRFGPNGGGELQSDQAQRQADLNAANDAFDKARARRDLANEGRGASLEEQKAAVAALEKAQKDQAEARLAVDKADLEVAKEKLGILERQYQAAESRGLKFGTQSQSQRLSTVFAFEEYARRGTTENMSPEQVSSLLGLGNEDLNRRIAAQGANTPEAQRINQIGKGLGLKGFESPEELAKQIQGTPQAGGPPGLQGQIAIKAEVDQAKAEQVLTEVAKKTLEGMSDVLMKITEVQVQKAIDDYSRKVRNGQGRTQ